MEFMSVGVPVVVANTKVDTYYFDDSVVRFFEAGNADALAARMLEVLTDENLRVGMMARASEYVARNNWETCKAEYLGLVDSLCSRPRFGRAMPALMPGQTSPTRG
jgi:glycosyltransferase involved in cell wall biosynthesis